MNLLPMYNKCIYHHEYDNSNLIHDQCISIPSSTNITDEELEIVANYIIKFFNEL